MSADHRGFVYPLEPLRLQAQWQLDALQRDLSGCASRLAALGRDRQARQVACDEAAKAALPGPENRFDPSAAHRRLAYLVDAQRQIAEVARRETAAQAELAEWQAKCQAAQLKLDGIERDREARLADHAVERGRQQAVAADQDWLARAAWHRHTADPEAAR